jgi:isocitrate dehydrogenase (NAD+)
MSKVHFVTLIPGDGIGPEVARATQRVIAATGVKIDWHETIAGEAAFERFGNPLPNATVEAIKVSKVALKGPTGTPIGDGFKSINVELRKIFGLYANLRPANHIIGAPSRYPGVDIVLVRENVEDFYCGTDEFVGPNRTSARATGENTRYGGERVFEFAFTYAMNHGRKKIAAAHKANILKAMYGIFLDAGRYVSEKYQQVQYDEYIVDNMAMQLVMNPRQFDMIVAPNLFGDILSDLCAGLIGGLGFAPGANIGDQHAIFEAVHGTAPDIAGQNKANPTALILSGAMMLDHLKEDAAADRIRRAVRKVIARGRVITGDVVYGKKMLGAMPSDLPDPSTTDRFTDEVIRMIESSD